MNNSALTLGRFDSPVTSLTLASLTSDTSSPINLYGAAFTLNYNGTSPITIAGVVSDVGGGLTSLGSTFTMTGTGTVVLSGANTYTGLTTVGAGNLVLNGSIFGDTLVNVGAILSGTGTVGGSATVNGGIAPGNSIGTLNVVGNYTQNTGSTYYLEINGTGQSDLINVTGAATLNGGQVVVTTLDGNVETTTPYTILTAAGGVTGQFGGITTTNLLLTPTLTYDANNAYLSFSQTVFSFDAVTPNQISVATQLEGIIDPTPEEFLILSTLATLPAADQQRALDEMSGQQYAALNLASEIAGRQFIRRLYDPLRSIVTTEPCYDPCSCEVACPTIDFWLEAGGGQTFLDGNANARSLRFSGYEITAGVQSTFNRDWTVGIAGTYIQDHIKYDVGGSGKNQWALVQFMDYTVHQTSMS